MKRILLSSLTVLLLAVVASQIVKLQECEATTATERSWESEPASAETAAFVEDSEVAIGEEMAQGNMFPFSDSNIPVSVAAELKSKRTIKVPVTKTVYEEMTIEMGDVTPLQQRYSVLMLKRAQRMTDEELEQAIANVEAELQEQDAAANSELKKAIEILEKLRQDAEGTPAAGRAGQALPILQGDAPGTESAPIYPTAPAPADFGFGQPVTPKLKS